MSDLDVLFFPYKEYKISIILVGTLISKIAYITFM